MRKEDYDFNLKRARDYVAYKDTIFNHINFIGKKGLGWLPLVYLIDKDEIYYSDGSEILIQN